MREQTVSARFHPETRQNDAEPNEPALLANAVKLAKCGTCSMPVIPETERCGQRYNRGNHEGPKRLSRHELQVTRGGEGEMFRLMSRKTQHKPRHHVPPTASAAQSEGEGREA